ncbi:MAG: MraY family glycosyltransferase, partial [Acidobacteriota bacterium]
GGAVLRPYLGLMAGGFLIVALGVYDDIKGLRAPVKFAVQTLAALIVIGMGTCVESFTNPLGGSFEVGWLGIPVAVLWIVGVTNAMNLIDGLDGLAVGSGSIAALGLFAIAVTVTLNPFVATVAIVLAGAGVGFLRHNFHPARMFLGDSGSMFIGFTLAVLGIEGSLKASAATVLFLPIIVLGIPIFDTLFAILRRAKRRVNPFKADREHIHHRLVRIGLHHRSVVLGIYFICAYLAVTAYAVAQFPYQMAFLFLLFLTVAGILGLRTLGFIEEKLEMGLAAGQGGRKPAPASRGAISGNGRIASGGGARAFSVQLCEVSGFGEGFADAALRESICEDIHDMLSRRMRVDAVVAEPFGADSLLLIIRTESGKDSLQGLMRGGLRCYFEDLRDRLGARPDFPRFRWFPVNAPSPAHGDRPPAKRGVTARVPLGRHRRAGVASS